MVSLLRGVMSMDWIVLGLWLMGFVLLVVVSSTLLFRVLDRRGHRKIEEELL